MIPDGLFRTDAQEAASMGAGHDHGHSHAPAGSTATAAYVGRLRVALSITLTVMVVEIVGGFVADSLALVADAAHMATPAPRSSPPSRTVCSCSASAATSCTRRSSGS